MKKLSVPVVLLVALGSTSSFATDLAAPSYRKAPLITKAPPIDPGYNWSGFYVGAHGGYAAGSAATGTFDPETYTTTLVSDPELRVRGETTPLFGLSAAPKGGFGGIQIGYNWQAVGSPWVFGIEADASFGRLRAEDAKPFAIVAGFSEGDASYTGVARLRQTIDAFGTVRGRIGHAADTLLVYATGGFAWASVETRFGVDSVAFGPFASFSPDERAALTSGGNASTKDVHYGYAVGGGAEWAFARNWSIKAEYVYLGFQNGGTTLVIPGGVANAGHFDLHTAKGGINYRF